MSVAKKGTAKADQKKSPESNRRSASRTDSHIPVPLPLSETLNTVAFTQDIISWFMLAQRKLPWRATPRDPYHALVSEAMLQQTQVSRVIDKFNAFIARFPTVQALANATSDQVTHAWAGLGYYRRANNLHKAAKMIVTEFGGVVPREVDDLLKLPGIGRYTAGAIASIAYNAPAPIVDGNIMRVLLRVSGLALPQDLPATQRWAWESATTLVNAANTAPVPNPAALNEGLMELGATICTPGPNPSCDSCPVKAHCQAFARNLQSSIPQPKSNKPSQELHCACLIIPNALGHVLFEKRPTGGLWSGLWQLPTLQSTPREWPQVKAWLTNSTRADSDLDGITFTYLLGFERTLTHRDVHFELWSAVPATSNNKIRGGPARGSLDSLDQVSRMIGFMNHQAQGVERRFVPLEDAHMLGLSNAQREALRLYANAADSFPRALRPLP